MKQLKAYKGAEVIDSGLEQEQQNANDDNQNINEIKIIELQDDKPQPAKEKENIREEKKGEQESNCGGNTSSDKCKFCCFTLLQIF